MARPVYIIDGSRTPFLKARTGPGPFTPVDLAVQCGRPLLARQSFEPAAFDQVILGCVNVIADEMNPARVAALRLGMGEAMVAFTVQINCGSGMQSIDTAYRYIQDGTADLILAGGAESLSHAPLVFSQGAVTSDRINGGSGMQSIDTAYRYIQDGTADLILAGGAESLSHAPLVFSQGAVNWYARLFAAHNIGARLSALLGFRPSFLKPVIGLEEGLTDPITDLNMGQTAELVGHLFHITRRQADQYAAESQQRLAAAQKSNYFAGEIEPAFARDGTVFDHDDGVRPDTTIDTLAKLKPAFERPWVKVTPGNSSQITDGACWIILASEEAVKTYKLAPKAVIVDSEWSALDPSVMGLGPVYCSTALLKRHHLALGDIELWELKEGFAAQVLGCLAAWNDAEFCRKVLHLDGALGNLDRTRLNVDGGAIGLGHPVGSTGARIVLHLVHALRRLKAKRGIASECIGGGQGGAMLVGAVW